MNILLTGGAGFIGSNLTKSLLNDDRVSKVRVLDNFCTGYRQNLQDVVNHPKFELMEGDITDFAICEKAMLGMDLVSHQAALGSVPRSIIDPINSNNTNITGTLNIYTAAKQANIKRIVYAASSSTYGDSESLPKVENIIGRPLSPYAVTKFVMELYVMFLQKHTIWNLLDYATLMYLVRTKVRKVLMQPLFLYLWMLY